MSERRTSLIAVVCGALLVLAANLVASVAPPLQLRRWVVAHSVLEGVSVIVASLIFAIGLSAPADARRTATRLLAFAFLAVALLDGLHLLTYGGMPELWVANTWHRNLFFWLAARLVSAAALLAVTARLAWPDWRPWFSGLGLALVAMTVGGVAAMAVWADGLVPPLYVEGEGLSPLKVGIEWVVVLLNVLTIVILLRRRAPLHQLDTPMLIVAVAYMTLSELCFTIFSLPGDLNNVLGHLMKAAAYLALYRAVFVATVRAPYSALRRSEQALSASRAMVESAFGQSASPKAVESVDGTYVRVNAAFAEFVGRTPQWFHHRAWEDVVHPDELTASREARARLLRGEATVLHQEKRFVHADGSVRWADLSRSRIRVEGTDAALLLVELQDVTARKRAEAELEASVGALRQSQKTEAVGRLAGGIAHDFNNLLSAILASASLLKAEVAGNASAVEEVAEVEAAARRGSALTRQLLAFSRQQKFSPERVDLRTVVLDFTSVLKRLTGAAVQLDVVTCDEPLTVQADRSQLEQVVLNLVINARDAVRPGGRITLVQQQVTLVEPCITPLATVPIGRWAVLEVTDDGCGMTPEVQARIYDPFFTTKPVGQGNGLGLSTVHGIVQQHGGAIALSSTPGHGSSFRLYLPIDATL